MILITNDDGIVAPGIRALVEVASKLDEVVVVAPDSPQSGKGHAITLDKGLKLRKVDIFGDIEAYECSGTPVDCVKLAKILLFKDRKIDLCLSGINHGANSSVNIIYSGTMSAAMEASLEGIMSVGFSLLDFSFEADFSGAKIYAEKVIRSIMDKPLMHCNLLNVNIPACKPEDIQGIKVCRQGDGAWVESYEEGKDAQGEPFYWLSGSFVSYESETSDDHDLWALKNNYVSVVPSGHDLTCYKGIDNYRYLENL
ncbi:MAG: 5'/3'-nucleotidase SurE [Saprospiraceae bacterium]|nr:MAG: 5'(3')-nucleotidase/polyphosphatase [Bacteroidetes bacterium OLB9]MCO6462946.1 5'/3'-nucleotidase SurE [Saprospiraceae bacterium]